MYLCLIIKRSEKTKYDCLSWWKEFVIRCAIGSKAKHRRSHVSWRCLDVVVYNGSAAVIACERARQCVVVHGRLQWQRHEMSSVGVSGRQSQGLEFARVATQENDWKGRQSWQDTNPDPAEHKQVAFACCCCYSTLIWLIFISRCNAQACLLVDIQIQDEKHRSLKPITPMYDPAGSHVRCLFSLYNIRSYSMYAQY